MRLAGGGGTGAYAAASGAVDGASLTAGGLGYTEPVVTVAGGGGTGASAAVTGTVSAVAVTAAGSGYIAPIVAFAGGGGTGAAATAAIDGSGAITGIAVTNRGSGYTSAPTVTITGAPGSGSAASATLTIDAIALTSGGKDYTAAPTISITDTVPGTGTGASVLATLTMTGITVTAGGTGYTSAPTVTLLGGGGTAATANASGAVSAITVTNGGSGYSGPAVTLTGGGGVGATATAVLTVGVITAITVMAGGSGYTSAPTVTITDAGPGTGAAADATLTITAVGLTTAGAGYTSPVVTIADTAPGTGTGANISATGTVDNVVLTSGGSGYTSPLVRLTGSGGTGATATATGIVTAVTVAAGGSGYSPNPVVTLSGGGGTGATAVAVVNPLTGAISRVDVTTGGSGYTSGPTVAITDATGTGASAYATLTLSNLALTSGGSGYTTAPAVSFLSAGGGTGATATATGGVGSISVMTPGAGYTTAPTVTLTGGGGSGATATAACALGTLSLGAGGTGYVAPVVVFVGGGGTGATATATVVGGAITGLTVTAGGTGYTTLPTIVIVDNVPGTGAAATASLIVSGIAVTAAGTGYSSPPTVTLVGGGPVTAATAAAALRVSSIALTSGGSGYATPAVSLIGGGGTGAAAVASGTVSGITVTNGGAGYAAPTVSITGGGGTGATAAATVDTVTGAITGFTITNGGTGYTSAPTVTITDNSGRSAAAKATLTLTGIAVTNGGVGYSSTPTVQIADTDPAAGAGAAAVATLTLTGFTVVAGGAGYSAPTVAVEGGGTGAAAAASITGAPGAMYTQNRAALHLHGGVTPWISDGTPHQWTTPAGETTPYPEGVCVYHVPDMPDPGPGSMTLFYSNQQSARLMFYHDHAYGITRLNVYAGGAAGYLLTDPTEQELVTSDVIPAEQIPLIIQDKTFVPPPAQLAAQDPTWDSAKYGGQGSLWFPHVYMPNQNPFDSMGMNAMGRWDYGPWFWPPFVGLAHGPVANPYYVPEGAEPPEIPGVPMPSIVPEAFMDTPVVNGTAYPYVTVEPKAYRFRILNACNDRFLNLQLYKAASNGRMWHPITGVLRNAAAGEVPMVPALPNPNDPNWPATWPTDNRDGGVPDPNAAGPKMIQIGTEGGFLPTPVVLDNQPIDYVYNRRDIVVLNVSSKTLFLGPAERADVIVDFSQYAGQTLILYNDAPAPVPGFDPRLDYYTGNPDLTSSGGALSTLPGYGPNMRTIMQIRVSGEGKLFLPTLRQGAADSHAAALVSGMVAAATTPPAYDVAALIAAFTSTSTTQGVFAASQDPIIVPQAAYGAAYNATFPDTFVAIQDMTTTFTPLGASAPLSLPLAPKAIQELFEMEYGRMNAILGVEIPNTNSTVQTTIPYAYPDPVTELLQDSITPLAPVAGDGTQVWKITHNGVDTHAIHFHLFNVQVINRVGWDGAIRPPDPNELGWKETVRMNPLEDCIVALRPVAPRVPFGLPESIRPLNPTTEIGSTMGFTNVAPNGTPVRTVNHLVNFGHEYVWHCHLLGHEENDMMRPMAFGVAVTVPAAPVLSASTAAGPKVNLQWTDATPPTPANLGNPANEIGFRIEREDTGSPGFAILTTALANQTTYSDASVLSGHTYRYRVVAFNAAGSSASDASLPLVIA